MYESRKAGASPVADHEHDARGGRIADVPDAGRTPDREAGDALAHRREAFSLLFSLTHARAETRFDDGTVLTGHVVAAPPHGSGSSANRRFRAPAHEGARGVRARSGASGARVGQGGELVRNRSVSRVVWLARAHVRLESAGGAPSVDLGHLVLGRGPGRARCRRIDTCRAPSRS
eukprot:scaffold72076_cov55-Phaeocystis_antarctica.AAC.1